MTQRENAHLLIVDDEPRVRQMLARYFEEEGFRISVAENGAVMRECLARETVHLVLLDIVLPGEDGLALARDLRSRFEVGIIMLTGRGDMVDRVVGLEIGADDYIPKPFHLREVLARVKSVLRRLRPARQDAATAPKSDDVLCFQGWRLNTARRRVFRPDGSEVQLTTGEFDLLLAFASHPCRVLDRDRLMDLTRGREWEVFDRSIDAQIARLRRKIEVDTRNPLLIKSVRGVGYVFASEVQEASDA